MCSSDLTSRVRVAVTVWLAVCMVVAIITMAVTLRTAAVVSFALGTVAVFIWRFASMRRDHQKDEPGYVWGQLNVLKGLIDELRQFRGTLHAGHELHGRVEQVITRAETAFDNDSSVLQRMERALGQCIEDVVLDREG